MGSQLESALALLELGGGSPGPLTSGLPEAAHVNKLASCAPGSRAGIGPIPGPLNRSSSSSPGSLCSVSIEKALPEDKGLYKCVAKNGAGQAECSCQVAVDGRWCPPVAITQSHLPHALLPPHLSRTAPRLPSPSKAFLLWVSSHLLQKHNRKESGRPA